MTMLHVLYVWFHLRLWLWYILDVQWVIATRMEMIRWADYDEVLFCLIIISISIIHSSFTFIVISYYNMDIVKQKLILCHYCYHHGLTHHEYPCPSVYTFSSLMNAVLWNKSINMNWMLTFFNSSIHSGIVST